MKRPALSSAAHGQGEPELLLNGTELLDLMQAVLEKGRPFRFQAKGWSMSPFIKENDVITVSALGKRRPRAGEVVAALHPETGRLVVHRVVSGRDEEFLLRGDNSPELDGYVPRVDILAGVDKVERNGRRLRLGLGPERAAIALLSRWNILRPGMMLVRCLLRRRVT